MLQTAATPHLFLRNRTFYFRLVVPERIRPVMGKREIRLSLQTPYLREAQNHARKLEVTVTKLFELIDKGEHFFQLTNDQIKMLTDRFFADRKPLLDLLEVIDFGQSQDEEENILRHQEELKSWIKTRNFEQVEYDVTSHLAELGMDVDKESLDHRRASLEVIKTLLDLSALDLARVRQDYGLEQTIVAKYETARPRVEEHGSAPGKPKEVKRLGEVLKQYEAHKIGRKDWSEKSIPDMKSNLGWLPFILGKEKPLPEITQKDMENFVSTLQKMPPNRNKKKIYKGKTAKELLAMDIEKPLQVKTINNIVTVVTTFFDYALRNEYVKKNYCAKIKLKDERRPDEQRNPFTLDEVVRVFTCERYRGNEFNNDWEYWLPILGFYTG
ncbi:MAG: DUF6538 domain-containing protein, partial [Desulfovibrionales bacterium]